ncbi:hypothetical protein DIJ64_06700 [Mycobacterium leprae]|uniref:Uncharacterized protein n=1 Tax=Mycobacterium leprae TaxID=1769 RepID=A0AAD0KTS1_MYCLR|nr:hypothetical protein DIJ64_06700 [Mycobacterium leprae]OAR20548.1 hypothetical protein A8144_10540 [Mycobacterium leprae 3125609]OAX70750.1 hypothetical protein A3216_10105 [Mycobacterium leprae 7935681]
MNDRTQNRTPHRSLATKQPKPNLHGKQSRLGKLRIFQQNRILIPILLPQRQSQMRIQDVGSVIKIVSKNKKSLIKIAAPLPKHWEFYLGNTKAILPNE